MGWIDRFGSRNHPTTVARKRSMQRAREGMAVTPEMLANYGAARAFILGEWFGASLMVASFAMLNLLQKRCPERLVDGHCPTALVGPPAWAAIAVGVGFLLVGTLAFWRSRRYYLDLDYPWARRWHAGATIVAGSAAIFWLLFGLLELLTLLGAPIFPS